MYICLAIGLLMLSSVCFAAASAGGPAEDPQLQLMRSRLPVPGDVVIPTAKVADLIPSVEAGAGLIDRVEVSDRPYSQAYRVRVNQKGKNAWAVQILTKESTQPIKRGDVIFVAFDARCEQAQQESGEGKVALFWQPPRPPFSGQLVTDTGISRQWSTYYSAFVVDRDYPAGGAQLTFHLAALPQELLIGGLVALDLGQKVNMRLLPYTAVTYPGRQADASWRAAAAERIERIRKGDLVVRVTDAAGAPVPDADVSVEMTRHAYGFGSFLPSVWQNENTEKYHFYSQKWFNKATTPVYWADWGWENPAARKDYHATAAWLKEKGFEVRGHNLVWPGWENLPKRIKEYENRPVELRRIVNDHVREVVTAMKPYGLSEMDVINEPRANHDLMDLLGEDVMVQWYKTAREADPKLKLYLNDYSILTAGGKTEREQEIYERTIQYLLDQGAPLDGIGMQGHFGSDLTDPARVLAILDRFAKFGKDIEVTEFTVDTRDEQAQADYERDFMTAFFSHPATVGIVRWGFWEGNIWIHSTAAIREDWTLKPNGVGYEKLVLGDWWTREQGRTDSTGQYRVRGFCGDYRITVKQAGQQKQVEAKLTRAGTHADVRF